MQTHPDTQAVVAFDIRLEPNEPLELELSAEVVIRRSINGCTMPAINARHRLLSPDDTDAMISLHGLPDDRPVAYDVIIDLPWSWTLTKYGSLSPRAHRRRGTAAGRRRYEQAIGAIEELDVSIARPRRFVRGGPFFAAGLDLGDGVRPRLRTGWEFASPWPLWIHALALESDLRSLTVVPSTEVASGNVWIVFPSAGLGVGAPVQVLPRPRAGIRTQLTLGWPFVGVLGTLDIFPVGGERPDLRGGVMLQVGL